MSTTTRTAPAAPEGLTLRRLPVPPYEPPYDDERTEDVPAVHGSLALALPLRVDSLPVPAVVRAPVLRLVRGAEEGFERGFGRQPTTSASLPDPKAWTARFAQAVLDVLAGARPATQLLRYTDETVYAALLRRAARARMAAGGGSSLTRPRVGSVHVCEPGDGVVESCVRVQRAGRAAAMAVRFEGLDGRWRCTALEIG